MAILLFVSLFEILNNRALVLKRDVSRKKDIPGGASGHFHQKGRVKTIPTHDGCFAAGRSYLPDDFTAITRQ